MMDGELRLFIDPSENPQVTMAREGLVQTPYSNVKSEFNKDLDFMFSKFLSVFSLCKIYRWSK